MSCSRETRTFIVDSDTERRERESELDTMSQRRREVLSMLSIGASSSSLALWMPRDAHALSPPGFKKDMSKFRKRTNVEADQYLELEAPSGTGIKYFDITVGKGPEPSEGDRIAVHFDVKLRNLTVATSRQGAGVTGGTPYGFQVGLNPGVIFSNSLFYLEL